MAHRTRRTGIIALSVLILVAGSGHGVPASTTPSSTPSSSGHPAAPGTRNFRRAPRGTTRMARLLHFAEVFSDFTGGYPVEPRILSGSHQLGRAMDLFEGDTGVKPYRVFSSRGQPETANDFVERVSVMIAGSGPIIRRYRVPGGGTMDFDVSQMDIADQMMAQGLGVAVWINVGARPFVADMNELGPMDADRASVLTKGIIMWATFNAFRTRGKTLRVATLGMHDGQDPILDGHPILKAHGLDWDHVPLRLARAFGAPIIRMWGRRGTDAGDLAPAMDLPSVAAFTAGVIGREAPDAYEAWRASLRPPGQ